MSALRIEVDFLLPHASFHRDEVFARDLDLDHLTLEDFR